MYVEILLKQVRQRKNVTLNRLSEKSGISTTHINDIENEKDINPDTKQTKPKNVITRHKCAVCGRTELDDPELEFRFCSKCNGNYEYCSEHLYTHEHVRWQGSKDNEE